jgi:presenilin-like A22 family membrane protease
MKHSFKITALLLAMFLFTQLLGLFVIHAYAPITTEQTIGNQTLNVTSHNLPYGTEPPQDIDPKSNLLSIIVSIAIAVILILILMKIKAEIFLRVWFFIVITIALGISINAFLLQANILYSSLIALVIALPLSIVKVFQRNIIVHNLTEVLIYPGIAAIFIPLLTVWTVVLLLLVISIYDIYAVWHSGFMQKMAKYQIQKVRVFGGFFVPYIDSKTRAMMDKFRALNRKAKANSQKKIKVHVAILGGGDVVFPLILAGVVLFKFGIIPAIIISLGATLALGFLFWISQKGRFYPAMPFISAGCLLALGLVYILF